MEEEIKVLKNCWVMTTDHVLDEGNIALKLAIKNVLNELERLKEAYNEELDENLKMAELLLEKQHKIEKLETENENISRELISRTDKLNDSIPKQIIRNKIKEYDGLKEIDITAYEEQIKPLKELLGDE